MEDEKPSSALLPNWQNRDNIENLTSVAEFSLGMFVRAHDGQHGGLRLTGRERVCVGGQHYSY
jgi:hypothetical protein